MCYVMTANTLAAALLFSALSVSAQGQSVICRATSDCSDIVDLGLMTARECCVNTPNALAFSVGEICSRCIVFGFLNDSFTGVEQGQGHSVQVGYQKGAAVASRNLHLNVQNTEGTAKRGANKDYTISTNSVRLLYQRPSELHNVQFIFRSDSIAQEPNETFTLKLEMAPGTSPLPTGDGVFFLDEMNMVILDSDTVDIVFTEDDFRGSEGDTNPQVPVMVAKSSRIATRVVLEVVPLTVEKANSTMPPLIPQNIPDNSTFAPPYADLDDFNDTAITITFEPDELANDDERDTPIPIFDDPINEADEQAFVVQLRLLESVNRSAVTLTRPASLCRIVDNDIIRIGFEQSEYTYLEPKFDETVDQFFVKDSGPVYLVKEDGVVSEQTFEVVVQLTNSVPPGTNFVPATFGEDYSVTSRPVVLRFPSDSQQLLVQFTLFSDKTPEGTEAFLMTSTPGDLVVFPGYLPPTTLFTETFVIIEHEVIVRIGFELTEYTVDESVGAVEVYVKVFDPPDEEELPLSIDLVIQTIAGTAGEADYQRISAQSLDVFLTFDNATRRLSFPLTIKDDNIAEMTENFTIELRFDPFTAPPSAVELSPNVSTITINDTDRGPLVSFERKSYTVFESQGFVEVCFSTSKGHNQPIDVVIQPVEKNVDNRASGGDDFLSSPITQTFEAFGEGNMLCANISLVEDSLYEGDEQFLVTFGNLPNMEAGVGLINETTVIILDDDATPPPPKLVETCRITEPLRVQPFSRNTMYGFMGTCEHTALRSCDLIPEFNVRVNVDFLTQSMENGAVGLLVNNLRYISREDGSFDDGGQTPLSSTATRREYVSSSNQIVVNFGDEVTNITYSIIGLEEDDPSFIEITVIHEYAGQNSSIQINVQTPNDTQLNFCGLCGSRFGDLVKPDGSIVQMMDLSAVQNFAQSYLVEPREQTLRPQRRECGSVRNDTVIGDPLYTVPVYNEAGKEYSLCYEVFGHTNSTLNLVSDTCVSINALYSAMDNPELGNIISSVGIRAKGMTDNSCHNIRVDLDGCSATIESPGIDPLTLTNMQTMQVDGISVKKYPSRVRIAAPNCENVRLVIWVVCENRNNQNMIKFVIARGVNLRASSHGLLGQFWNVPVTFTKYTGADLPDGYNPEKIYVVKVQPESSAPRSFLGEFYHLTWDKIREPCLYVGTSQGGATYEVEDPNDSIIEGNYRDYIIDNGDLFETTYIYDRFDEGRC